MRLALLFLALIIAVVAGVAVFQFSGGKNEAPQTQTAAPANTSLSSVSTVDVMVAKVGIPAGTVLDETMVDKQPWPSHLVAESFIVSTSEDAKVVGKIARATFQAREPLLASKLANPGDPSFMAGNLPPGARAVTLSVDAISGVAGYVLAGDRVDILLTHNIPDEQNAKNNPKIVSSFNSKPAVTEVLIPNALVLAVNVRPAAVKETNPNNTPSSLTVQVSDQGAQQIRLAEKQGTLSAALRSVADKTSDELLPGPTMAALLTRAGMNDTGANVSGETIKVVRGTRKEATTNENLQDTQGVQQPETIANP